MKLLIIRHGPAGDKRRFAKTGRPDAARPLTARGKDKMRQAAKGLAKVADRPGLLASSPLERARQTADIVDAAFGGVRRAELPLLSPDADPRTLVPWLASRREGSLALVGHEPHLSRLIALICGSERSITELKKGQACLLEFDPEIRRAIILWSLRPRHLRALAP